VYRSNAGGAECSTEEYFRKNIHAPALNCLNKDLTSRFGKDQCLALNIAHLIPAFFPNEDSQWDSLWLALKKYDEFLDEEAIVRAEIRHWRER